MSSASGKAMIERAAKLKADKSSACSRTESSSMAEPLESELAEGMEPEAAPQGPEVPDQGHKPVTRKRPRSSASAATAVTKSTTSPAPEGPQTPAAPVTGGISFNDPTFDFGRITNLIFDPQGPHYGTYKAVYAHTSTMANLCMRLGVHPPVSATQVQLRLWLANVCGTAKSMTVDVNTGEASVEDFESEAPNFVVPASDLPATSASL